MSTCSIFEDGNTDPKKAGGSFKMGDAFFDANGERIAYCTDAQAQANRDAAANKKSSITISTGDKKPSYRDRILKK